MIVLCQYLCKTVKLFKVAYNRGKLGLFYLNYVKQSYDVCCEINSFSRYGSNKVPHVIVFMAIHILSPYFVGSSQLNRNILSNIFHLSSEGDIRENCVQM
ncbi:hypothetical protein RF11_03710 [Thelohanellus kitauei]|uniref:Uncharacterized protein n=1 Tax=Thelohanellus kitauei TaxID=669202 RepID=A0A0C2MVC7_THEKT|nr:hypothetical protein RF11_03710 [Thelohanellus kitauei]